MTIVIYFWVDYYMLIFKQHLNIEVEVILITKDILSVH